jgi:predicted ATPase/class 3 adenylate cyclase
MADESRFGGWLRRRRKALNLTQADPPSGTITFLFTDIEGSTSLWQQHPRAMAEALARHEAILRDAIVTHGGYTYKMVGDAFQAAFPTAPCALLAAVAGQQALADQDWGLIGALRVRMALDSGVVEERCHDYVGPLLNRLARLIAAGHGCQILLSAATYELLRTHDLPGVTLRDLGLHKFKGLLRLEPVYQVVAHNLRADFPPLKSLPLHRANLPARLTPLLGRECELEQVAGLLRGADVRLLTLTGPGGVGKTRLALQVGAEVLDEFADGACFVDLSPISNPDMVVTVIGQVLGMREAGTQLLIERIKAALRDQQRLLLLDNFEQVLSAAPLLADLLAAAPQLKILVTSRTALHLSGEHDFPILPLAIPDTSVELPIEHLTQYPAVRLFIERSQAVKPDFQVTSEQASAVAAICARLEGLPLAIELAAARSKMFPPQAMLARLSRRLQFLTGGARDFPARHQTLRNAIDWSYTLLGAEEQVLFWRLGVFIGGWTMEAAEAVCNAAGDLSLDVVEGVAALLDHSLVRQAELVHDEPRFTMLETIREYALEQLTACGENTALRSQHAAYYTALVEMAAPHLHGPAQLSWLERLDPEYDNIQAALQWAFDHDASDLGGRLSAALWRFWAIRSRLDEGRYWLETALAQQPPLAVDIRAPILYRAAILALFCGDQARTVTLARECLTLSRPLGDKCACAYALLTLSGVAIHQGDYTQATTLLTESIALFNEIDHTPGQTWALDWMGDVARIQDDLVRATALYQESLALRRITNDLEGIGWSCRHLGDLAGIRGNDDQALAFYWESHEMFQVIHHKEATASVLHRIAQVELVCGRLDQAQAACEQSLALSREMGLSGAMTHTLHWLGNIACEQGDYARAWALHTEGMALAIRLKSPDASTCGLRAIARLAAVQGQLHRAARLFGAAEVLLEPISRWEFPFEQRYYIPIIDMLRVQMDAAAWAATWDAARVLTIEQAIDEALGKYARHAGM